VVIPGMQECLDQIGGQEPPATGDHDSASRKAIPWERSTGNPFEIGLHDRMLGCGGRHQWHGATTRVQSIWGGVGRILGLKNLMPLLIKVRGRWRAWKSTSECLVRNQSDIANRMLPYPFAVLVSLVTGRFGAESYWNGVLWFLTSLGISFIITTNWCTVCLVTRYFHIFRKLFARQVGIHVLKWS